MNIETKYIRRELSAVIEEAYRYFSVITITGPRQSGICFRTYRITLWRTSMYGVLPKMIR